MAKDSTYYVVCPNSKKGLYAELLAVNCAVSLLVQGIKKVVILIDGEKSRDFPKVKEIEVQVVKDLTKEIDGKDKKTVFNYDSILFKSFKDAPKLISCGESKVKGELVTETLVLKNYEGLKEVSKINNSLEAVYDRSVLIGFKKHSAGFVLNYATKYA